MRQLNKLKIVFSGEDFPHSRWKFNCKHEGVLQNLMHLSQLSILKVVNAYAIMFPPNITKLTLSGVSCLNEDTMNAIGNLTKLQIFIIKGDKWFTDSWFSDLYFDLNCVENGFPQLVVFQMTSMPIRNWKLANGSMSHLQSLSIKNCAKLDSLPSELWSLTALRKVYVGRPSNPMASLLQNLEVKNGCELTVDSMEA